MYIYLYACWYESILYACLFIFIMYDFLFVLKKIMLPILVTRNRL